MGSVGLPPGPIHNANHETSHHLFKDEAGRGIRANASAKSHAELNDSTELDPGNPAELASQSRELASRLRQLNVFGGCCGTDHRHIQQVYEACAPLFS